VQYSVSPGLKDIKEYKRIIVGQASIARRLS